MRRQPGPGPVPLPVDADGLRPELFAAALRATGARGLVCQPLFQNPAGAVLARERAAPWEPGGQRIPGTPRRRLPGARPGRGAVHEGRWRPLVQRLRARDNRQVTDTSDLLAAAERHPLPPGYACSADPARFDADLVHHWLSSDAYWALGRGREEHARMLEGSLAYGLYEEASGAQVGCARLVTDLAAFAYLCDVYVDRAFRGRGLGTAFVAAVLADLVRRSPHGMRGILLATRDAHGVYAELGFTPLPAPERWMVLGDP